MGVWFTCIAFQMSGPNSRIRPGEDRLSQLLAGLREFFAPARRAFMNATRGLPSFGGELISGLTTGDTTRVSESLEMKMKTASLTHLTAVSGANCHVVILVVFFVLARLGCTLIWRTLGALVALTCFVVFVTPQASVARAAVMAVAMLVGLAAGRLASGLPALALSVIVLLVVEPRWALDYGFSLSVLATVGLLTLAQPLADLMTTWRVGSWRFGRLMSPTVRLAVAVPTAASIACQPILILLQPSLPTYGVLANLLCEPIAAFATVSGLLVAVTASTLPAASSALAWVAWLPAEWIGRVAELISWLPFPRLAWFDGLLGAALCSALCIALVLLIIRPRSFAPRMWSSLSKASVAFLVVPLLITASSGLWRSIRMPADWSIAACDVGQGDAFVLRSPDDRGEPHFALIDTGRNETPIHECMTRLGITTLDFVVLTHWDSDHVGGVNAIITMTHRLYVIHPADESEQLLLNHLTQPGLTIVFAHAGMSGALGEAAWQILWPDGRTASMQTGNAGSIAMLWTIDGVRFATLADLGEQAQETLAAHFLDLPQVDVLKVAHHGSSDTSQNLTMRLHPKIALIGVGANNGYGHPSRRAVSQLEAIGAEIERTDRNGMVLVSRDGDHLLVYGDR